MCNKPAPARDIQYKDGAKQLKCITCYHLLSTCCYSANTMLQGLHIMLSRPTYIHTWSMHLVTDTSEYKAVDRGPSFCPPLLLINLILATISALSAIGLTFCMYWERLEASLVMQRRRRRRRRTVDKMSGRRNVCWWCWCVCMFGDIFNKHLDSYVCWLWVTASA